MCNYYRVVIYYIASNNCKAILSSMHFFSNCKYNFTIGICLIDSIISIIILLDISNYLKFMLSFLNDLKF